MNNVSTNQVNEHTRSNTMQSTKGEQLHSQGISNSSPAIVEQDLETSANTVEVSSKPKTEKRTMAHMMPYLISAYIGEKSFSDIAEETGKKEIEIEQLLTTNFHKASRKLRDLKNHAEFTIDQMSSENIDATEVQYQLMTAKRGLAKIISELNQFAFVR